MATVAAVETKIVLPYLPNRHLLPDNFLEKIYNDILNDGLADTVFHEKLPTLDEWVHFATKDVVLNIFVDLEENTYPGIAWLADISVMPAFVRAWGSFAFFRKFWHPELTDHYGRACLREWFEVVGVDLLLGLTPTPNRLAKHFCERVGMRYIAEAPGYTMYKGGRCDGLICMLTKEVFRAQGGYPYR